MGRREPNSESRSGQCIAPWEAGQSGRLALSGALSATGSASAFLESLSGDGSFDTPCQFLSPRVVGQQRHSPITREGQLVQMADLVEMPHRLPMCHASLLRSGRWNVNSPRSTGEASGTHPQPPSSVVPARRRPPPSACPHCLAAADRPYPHRQVTLPAAAKQWHTLIVHPHDHGHPRGGFKSKAATSHRTPKGGYRVVKADGRDLAGPRMRGKNGETASFLRIATRFVRAGRIGIGASSTHAPRLGRRPWIWRSTRSI